MFILIVFNSYKQIFCQPPPASILRHFWQKLADDLRPNKTFWQRVFPLVIYSANRRSKRLYGFCNHSLNTAIAARRLTAQR